MKKVYVSVAKTVEHWNSEKGAGIKRDGESDSSHWGVDVSCMNGSFVWDGVRTFEDKLKEYLLVHVGYQSHQLAIMDNGRISFNMIENGDGEEVYNDRAYKGQLYLCNYDVYIEIHTIEEPNKELLSLLLPKAMMY